MKAVIVEHRNETGSLREVEVPVPGPREVQVRITAASVNPIDWKMRDSGEHSLPFILGQDFAGIVVDTGPNARKYSIGDRVFGLARAHGAYAEFTVVPEDDRGSPIAKIPDNVGDADAAALPTAGLTALASVELLGIRAGSRVAILGATGGVGEFAIQIAHARGAHVVGTGHSRNAELAESLGVDRYIAYDKENVVRALGTDAFDAAIDVVDDADAVKALLPAIRRGGSFVSTIGALNADDWRAHGITAHNLVVSETPQWSHAGLRELARLVEEGTVHVHIGAERDLSDAVQALEQSKSGTIAGKIVVSVERGTI